MTSKYIVRHRHPIDKPDYQRKCQKALKSTGVLVLEGFFSYKAVTQVVNKSIGREAEAFFTTSTHNVYLTQSDPKLSKTHPFNRQVKSNKGLIADDQVPADSPLRYLYDDDSFRAFLCAVLDIKEIFPYEDDVSSSNIHFAPENCELGWHFDNSSFAVTMLLQAPEAGGHFEYVTNVRDEQIGEMGFKAVEAILNGETPVERLAFKPGDLVLFRGRNTMHRVTKTKGALTRMMVVFAFNDQPGIALSKSALYTFYGRTN